MEIQVKVCGVFCNILRFSLKSLDNSEAQEFFSNIKKLIFQELLMSDLKHVFL